MTLPAGFFEIHKNLPREGPGSRAALDRALLAAGPPRNAAICDAGCGPGADIGGLLERCPTGSVLAVDTHAPFVNEVRARYADDPRVTAKVMDMKDISGPFDLIWCAGALYFLGLGPGLKLFRDRLCAGGVLAFSHPCFFTPDPSDAARAFWGGESVDVTDAAALVENVRQAGFEVLDAMKLPDEAWEAYYGPIEARIAALRSGADAALRAAIALEETEIRAWRAVRGETGYEQIVARRA